jgi:hypothetical protein
VIKELQNNTQRKDISGLLFKWLASWHSQRYNRFAPFNLPKAFALAKRKFLFPAPIYLPPPGFQFLPLVSQFRNLRTKISSLSLLHLHTQSLSLFQKWVFLHHWWLKHKFGTLSTRFYTHWST